MEIQTLVKQLTEDTALQEQLVEIYDNEPFHNQFYTRGNWKSPRINREIYNIIIQLLNQAEPQPSISNTLLLKILFLFSDKDTCSLDTNNKSPLHEYADSLLSSIDKCFKYSNFEVFTYNKNYPLADFATLIEEVLELFFHHSHFMDKSQYTKAANYVLPYAKQFTKNGSNLIFTFLEYHNNPIEKYVELFLFYIENCREEEDSHGFLATMVLDMFSVYVDTSDFEYKQSFKVIKQLFSEKTEWQTSEAAFLLEYCFIYPLRLYEKEHDEEAFEVRWQRAKKVVSKNKNTYKSMEFCLKNLPENSNTAQIQKLYDDATDFLNQPKKYTLNTKPNIVFKDFGLKLWVIEALMFEKEVLKPKLTFDDFILEYHKREISREEDGYEIIPEIKKYFKQLDITQEQLNQVTELIMDDGIGGGASVIEEMWPFYDPGCGDEPIKVTNKAIEDLDLLPNLKKIIGLEYTNPSKRLRDALIIRNIELVAYE